MSTSAGEEITNSFTALPSPLTGKMLSQAKLVEVLHPIGNA